MMGKIGREDIGNIIKQLEPVFLEKKGYGLCKVRNEAILLGSGATSCVYEIYDLDHPKKKYAAKCMVPDGTQISVEHVIQTAKIQHDLSEQSEHITGVSAVWTLKVNLDEEGNLVYLCEIDQPIYKRMDGFEFQIVLMEKLDPVFEHDKYGQVRLLREDLQTEKGIRLFAKQIGMALAVVHNNGFLHRDIKLENVFWDEKKQIYKLGDFGMARYVGTGSAETIVQTSGYGAPEIVRHLADSYDQRADIYSFGITLYLLLNKLCFPASAGYFMNEIQYSRNFVVPAPVEASEDMARIIRKMCRYTYKERYQSVEEILEEFEEIEAVELDIHPEYMAGETVTYCDEKCMQNSDMSDSKKRTGVKEDIEAESGEDDPEDHTMTREQRIKEARAKARIRMMHDVICTGGFTVLFYILCCVFWYGDIVGASLLGWLFPALLIMEAIFVKTKNFHWISGVVICGIAIRVYMISQFAFASVVTVVAVLTGLPSVMAGCALGMGCACIFAAPRDGDLWNRFLAYDIRWIVAGVVAVVVIFTVIREKKERGNR